MRRERFFRMERAEAMALLSAAPLVHLATTAPDGAPILRALNSVVVDGALCFHAAPVGEKATALGRPAVICAEEIVATVPSYFIDAERACPATTLYRSAQAHGTIEAVEPIADKARVLQALMHKYQPEGGHAPLDAAHPSFAALYDKEVAALWIGRVRLDAVDGKAKLAQNRSPAERVRLCEGLWARGGEGDPRAIELIRAANPDTPTPAFLRFEATNGRSHPLTLHCALGPDDVAPAVALLARQYWNDIHTPEAVAGALAGSPVWVGARDGDGRLCACARALGDGHKFAWIYDVVVAPEWRGCGLGAAVMRLCLDHPRVRSAARVFLRTRDAQSFYRKLGFIDAGEEPPRNFTSTSMLRIQR